MAYTVALDKDGKPKKLPDTIGERKTASLPGNPEWPEHKRPDMNRDKYGPLPNTNLPPMKKASTRTKRKKWVG